MTQIEWTHMPGFKGETWNPVVGCQIVSKGCTNCYAMKFAARLLDGNAKTPHYAGTTRQVNGQAVWTGKIGIAPDAAFTAPLRAKAPRCYFVNSMGDLFAEGVPDEAIDRAYAEEMSIADHEALLDRLQSVDGMVVLSGYPSTLYDDALKGWTRREREALADGARKRTEVLWLNPACVAALEAENHQPPLIAEDAA